MRPKEVGIIRKAEACKDQVRTTTARVTEAKTTETSQARVFEIITAFTKSLLLVLVFFSTPALAQYYTFKENHKPAFESPQMILAQAGQNFSQLLQWAYHEQLRPQANEKYNRKLHFGTWILDPRTGECHDTRARVLIRDSEKPVGFASNNPCRVYSGQWTDPYSGSVLKLAQEIEIDHVVALKNAYDSGAWAWSSRVRCLYSNFMGHDKHLISSYSRENQQKSDHAPDRWMPSNPNYTCQHLQNWLMVKYIWNLNMAETEAHVIAQLIQKHQCQDQMFFPPRNLVAKIRNTIRQDLKICH